MKIGIIGQKWLAHEVLKQLVGHHEVEFVAAPNEKDRLFQSAKAAGVAAVAYQANGLQELEAFKVDLLICAHAFIFIPAAIRNIAANAIGYHPSLLPLFKGRHAVEDAISARQRMTGGSVYHLIDHMDAGPVAFQDWCFIREGETASDLWRRALAPMGVELLMKAVDYLDCYGFLPAEGQEPLNAESVLV